MTGTSRRGFIKSSIATSAAAIVLSQFDDVSAVFARDAMNQEDPTSDEEFERLAENYLLAPEITYLNHASIGTMPKPVHTARAAYLDLCETNPWLYMWSGKWDKARETVREKSARLLSCSASEIAITHNTTEMFNTIASGLPLQPNDEVLFSTLCHAGASLPFEHRAKSGKYKTRRFDFPVSKLPSISLGDVVEAYAGQIKPETRALIIPHVDNTVGLRYPIRELVEMARDKGVEFIGVDAAQTVGMLPLDVASLNLDFLATSPHKWLGAPKGVGLAYINQRMLSVLEPMWVTWGQGRWANSARIYEDYGTRNLAEVLALGHCIDFNLKIAPNAREQRLKDLWSFTRNAVAKQAHLAWTSPDEWELASAVFSIKVQPKADELANRLFAEHGIVVRPFTTLGLNNLRVSPNVFTAKSEIQKLIDHTK